MATNPQGGLNRPGPQGKAEELSEEELLDALNHLKLLHIQCRELRTTVPRMLEPLTNKHATQRDALVAFQSSVANASAELRDFRALYTNEESKTVLEQARKSREAQPKGIKPWRARDHPDWLDWEEKVKEEKKEA